MATALTDGQSADFAALINEVAAAPQNSITATAIERMSVWAVASGVYTDRASFISQFDDAPFRTLIAWGSLGFYAAVSLSDASVAVLAEIVEALDKAPNHPLDANLIDRLLPTLEDGSYLVNDTKTKDALKTFPYAALMAWAWWMNVTDGNLPFNWLDADPAF